MVILVLAVGLEVVPDERSIWGTKLMFFITADGKLRIELIIRVDHK